MTFHGCYVGTVAEVKYFSSHPDLNLAPQFLEMQWWDECLAFHACKQTADLRQAYGTGWPTTHYGASHSYLSLKDALLQDLLRV